MHSLIIPCSALARYSHHTKLLKGTFSLVPQLDEGHGYRNFISCFMGHIDNINLSLSCCYTQLANQVGGSACGYAFGSLQTKLWYSQTLEGQPHQPDHLMCYVVKFVSMETFAIFFMPAIWGLSTCLGNLKNRSTTNSFKLHYVLSLKSTQNILVTVRQ